MERKNIGPFVKWVGGKRQFLKYINEILPTTFNNYHEPFVGGGAVFFHLLKNQKINRKAYLNDLNNRLITTYKVVSEEPNKLMKKLDKYQKNSNETFYKDERKKIQKYKSDLSIASWFIYVNKAGFNGMYRVNSKGGFNVPYGKNDDKSLYSKENIISNYNAMKEIELILSSKSFEESFEKIKKGDFVFIDPPYDYEPEIKNGFTRYINPDFKREMQIKLFELIKEIDKKGAFFLSTNHGTKLIRELYKEFDITTKKAYRYINSDSTKRKNNAKEVFIKNY